MPFFSEWIHWEGKLFMIKLCASVYVFPSVATPLFIALWQCPKVTAISNVIVPVSSSRLMTLRYMQYTCEESLQSQFHFLLSECISLLGHETTTTPLSGFFSLSVIFCLFRSFIQLHVLNKPAFSMVEIQVMALSTRLWQYH